MFQPVLATLLILLNGFGRYGGRFRNSGHVNLPRMFLINAQELKTRLSRIYIYIHIIYKPASREVGRYCFAASSCKLNQNGKLFNACVRSYSSILPEMFAVPFCVDLC